MLIKQDDLEWAAENAGLDTSAVYARYRGRGMYGEECVGLVHDFVGELLQFVLELDAAGVNLDPFVKDARQDRMGLSMITYFPGVQIGEVA